MTAKHRIAAITAASLTTLTIGACLYLGSNLPPRLHLWTQSTPGIAGFFFAALFLTILWLGLRALSPKFIDPAWSYIVLGAIPIYVLGAAGLGASVLLMAGACALGFSLTICLFRSELVAALQSGPPIALLLLLTSTGLSLLSVVFLATSFTDQITSGLYVTLLGAAVLLGLHFGGLRHLRAIVSRARAPAADNLSLWELGFLSVSILVVLILIGFVSLPDTGADAVSAYLGFFEFVRQNGGWHHDPGLAVWSLQPIGGLYQALCVMIIGGDGAAAILNLFWFLAAMVCIGLIALQISQSRLAGLIAAALYASLPITINITGHFYYDNAVAFYLAASVLAVVLAKMQPAHRRLYLFLACAALAGACGTKFTMWVAAPILFLYPLALVRRELGLLSVLVFSMAGFLLLTVLPVVLYAWTTTGNPVFPYYNDIFESAYYAAEQHDYIHAGYFGFDALFQMVFATDTFSPVENRGAAGLIALLFPIALILGLLHPNSRQWIPLLGLSIVALWLIIIIQNDLRLLWPLIAICIAMTVGVSFILVEGAKLSRSAVTVSLAILTAAQLALMPSGSWSMMLYPVKAVFMPAERHAFLNQRAPHQAINAFLDSLQESPQRRLYISAQQGRNGAITFEDNWYNYIWHDTFRNLQTPGQFEAFFRDIGVDAIIMGTQSWRDRVPVAFYQAIVDFDVYAMPNHQVFLAPMRLAYPLSAQPYESTQHLINKSFQAAGTPPQNRLNLRFGIDPDAAGQFRVKFEYICDVDRSFEPVVSYRSQDETYVEYRRRQPCLGPAKRGLAIFDVDLPKRADPAADIFIGLWSTGRDSPIQVFNLEAGLKPRRAARPNSTNLPLDGAAQTSH